jgi:hypothetical protein
MRIPILLSFLLVAAGTALAQLAAEPAGAPPAELSAEMLAALQDEGHKLVEGGEVYAEFWFRETGVDGSDSGEIDVSWSTAPHGVFIGVVRFPNQVQDRRGQQIKPGLYTLRFSFYPVDGAHQGAEPSRDFLVLSPAADDKDPAAKPDFDTLMEMSRKASGTPHPAALAIWKAESDWQPGLVELGKDQVLNVKIGDTQISVIVKGVNSHA